MQKMKNKRGLSPVIATVLLVSLALVLGAIVFMWAKSFVGEEVVKFSEPIEKSCESVSFDADAYYDEDSLKIDVVNRGSIPIFGISVKTTDLFGNVEKSEKLEGDTIEVGEIASFEFAGIEGADKIKIVPIIVGTAGEDGPMKSYTCSENFGIDVPVT